MFASAKSWTVWNHTHAHSQLASQIAYWVTRKHKFANCLWRIISPSLLLLLLLLLRGPLPRARDRQERANEREKERSSRLKHVTAGSECCYLLPLHFSEKERWVTCVTVAAAVIAAVVVAAARLFLTVCSMEICIGKKCCWKGSAKMRKKIFSVLTHQRVFFWCGRRRRRGRFWWLCRQFDSLTVYLCVFWLIFFSDYCHALYALFDILVCFTAFFLSDEIFLLLWK